MCAPIAIYYIEVSRGFPHPFFPTISPSLASAPRRRWGVSPLALALPVLWVLLIIRLWAHGFHKVLESLRRASFSSPIALEHLQDFIYFAYTFYIGLLEEPAVLEDDLAAVLSSSISSMQAVDAVYAPYVHELPYRIPASNSQLNLARPQLDVRLGSSSVSPVRFRFLSLSAFIRSSPVVGTPSLHLRLSPFVGPIAHLAFLFCPIKPPSGTLRNGTPSKPGPAAPSSRRKTPLSCAPAPPDTDGSAALPDGPFKEYKLMSSASND
ncbi:hypothetical protein CONPUDRAFT_159489 [Coniophora puteana RWD-64-598 SS2]|uniref:Uncharacterized protein n=1 Tax=Coniophora puteana (strain RWD-64-598) TaxID=741705 RepID=A0A5M3M9L7_CONPW|nr:uncharacterized protein CONPUDRAFT_159489 [Coniophora puteana RWD-64-598 SS2]EIW75365.1 hypothetical protein CONPUDRAFT_159489 [Coniophora puteana RWD-64-598 SS2]